MIKKTVTFEDFNGVQQTKDLYFHLSKSELIQLEAENAKVHRADPNAPISENEEVTVTGGFRAMLEQVMNTGDGREIMEIFNKIIGLSYGLRSEDGLSFRKSEEITAEFRATAAFDAFFMEIVTDAKAAAEFVNGIVPADIAKAVAEQDKPLGPPVVQEQPKVEEAPAKLETIDPATLTEEELAEILSRRNQ